LCTVRARGAQDERGPWESKARSYISHFAVCACHERPRLPM
jgi:hypothetical protein